MDSSNCRLTQVRKEFSEMNSAETAQSSSCKTTPTITSCPFTSVSSRTGLLSTRVSLSLLVVSYLVMTSWMSLTSASPVGLLQETEELALKSLLGRNDQLIGSTRNQLPSFLQGEGACVAGSLERDICERCAKATKSPVAYPLCCKDISDGRQYCRNLLDFNPFARRSRRSHPAAFDVQVVDTPSQQMQRTN